MKKFLLPILLSSLAVPFAAAEETPSSWGNYILPQNSDYRVFFNPFDEGKSLPILWGFDTAWNDYGNMLRGVRFAGKDAVGVARVSFTPQAQVTQRGVLPEALAKILDERMKNVALIGKKVDIALNLDGVNMLKEVYGGYKYENPDDPWHSPKEYIGDVKEQGPRWADLIDATAAAVEAKGYRVVSAAPLNEPDLEVNGTPKELFLEIAKCLNDHETYPRFRDIRVSGGNTLNNDEALPWYDYLKEYLDEGNTHQLAGSFDNYASFFSRVREDGKYATADELHNVMEAMVGVEYGMQTGIWWGTAEQARGEFMKASFGKRLGYAENRSAWAAGSVYRSPHGKLQGFFGCSERQARPSVFNIVSLKGDIFVNGYGPAREYSVALPGDPNGTYQTELQRNAETVVSIENGEDIRPVIDGEYAIVNKGSRKVLGGAGGSTANLSEIEQQAYTKGAHQLWNVTPVPYNIGGDFSYFFIRNSKDGQAMDNLNWNLEVGGKVIAYGAGNNSVQQWALEYDGDGWFHIRNKHSGLYLECPASAATPNVVQNERNDLDSQKWRLLPAVAELEFDAPEAPASLKVSANNASVVLEWNPSASADDVTYTVLRAEKGSDSYSTIARGLKATTFIDNSTEEKTYSYKVRAEDLAGNRSAASSAVEAAPRGLGLIADFPMTSDLKDVTANGFSLAESDVTDFRKNKWNPSGSQFARLPYTLMQRRNLTVMMNVELGSRSDDKILFTTGAGEGSALELSVRKNGRSVLRAVNGSVEKEITGPAAEIGKEAHVAFTLEGDKAALYMNGVKAGEENFAGAFPEHRLLTYLCRGQLTESLLLRGRIGGLKVYNRALSETEIAALAASSAVEDIEGATRSEIGREYWTPQGVRIESPATTGVTIVRVLYSDGSEEVRKQLKK